LKRSSWEKFSEARKRFRRITQELDKSLPDLINTLQEFIDSRSDGKNSVYKAETPVVYNSALDEITPESTVKLILTADNPGRREQAAQNRRYLIGPSGKIAQKFFRDNPALGIDFLKNVIILNKTPIHTPRTNDLRRLCLLGGSSLARALEDSQKKMAQLLLEFQEALDTPVYIIGYSEMKKGGIFEVYTEKIKELYAQKPQLYKRLFFFRHFSMNQFTIDLKKQSLPAEPVEKSLARIGVTYRERILGR